MRKLIDAVGARELFYGAVVVVASLLAALLLHVGAGPEAPDNPGAAAQLARSAADDAALSAAHGAE